MSPPVADSTKDVDKVEKKQAQRRINKPLIEKRRRARINECLSQLKAIVLQESDSTKLPRSSKLEKADILEMTVEFIKSRLSSAAATTTATTTTTPDYRAKEHTEIPTAVSIDEYTAGYSKCVEEISHFLEQTHTLNETIKQDVVSHISQKLNKNTNTEGKEIKIRNIDKIPIIPIKKRKLKMRSDDGPEPEVMDLSVKEEPAIELQSSDHNQPLNLSTMSEVHVQTKSIDRHKISNQHIPMGLLCGGQIMLLVQVPPTLTNQQFMTQGVTSQLHHISKPGLTETGLTHTLTTQSMISSVPQNVFKTESNTIFSESDLKLSALDVQTLQQQNDASAKVRQNLENESDCSPALPVINNANRNDMAGSADGDHWRPW